MKCAFPTELLEGQMESCGGWGGGDHKSLHQIYVLTFFGDFHWSFQDVPTLSDRSVVADSSSSSLLSPPPELRDAIVG